MKKIIKITGNADAQAGSEEGEKNEKDRQQPSAATPIGESWVMIKKNKPATLIIPDKFGKAV